MSFKRFAILSMFATIVSTSAPAMESQPCKVRRHQRPIGNQANVPLHHIPKKHVFGRRAGLHRPKGRYPYVGGRRTPKGVYLFQ